MGDDIPTRQEGRVFLDGPLRLTPDDRWLGAAVVEGIAVWDAATGALDRIIPTGHDPADQYHTALRWTWNGELVAFEDRVTANPNPPFIAKVIDSSGSLVMLLEDGRDRGFDLSLSPDGTRLALTRGGPEIYAVPEAELLASIDLEGGEQALYVSRTYLPDGRLLFHSELDQIPPQIWEPDGSALIRAMDIGQPYYAFHSPTGEAAAFVVEDPGAELRVVELPGLETIGALPLPEGRGVHLALSPTGTQVAWATRVGGRADQVLRLFDVASGQVSEHEGSPSPITHLVWSSDGSRLHTFSQEAVLGWDPATGQVTTEFMPA